MINEFENFDSVTGWVPSASASIHGLCPDTDYIAGGLSNSLILKFSAVNSYCSKTFATPISTVGYSQLVLHTISRVNRTNDYSKYTDFYYKIELGTGKSYYLPTPETFSDITIDISDIATIEYIKITYLGTAEDYLFLSYGCLVQDEFPLNIFLGIKKEIDKQLLIIQDSFEVGTISGVIGDKQLTFTAYPRYIDRYSAVRIHSGAVDEIHHIQDHTSTEYKFSSLYGGLALTHDFTASKVYLHLVCEYGKKHREIVIPSINIWGVTPEPEYLDNDQDHVLDTWKESGTMAERPVGRFYKYDIMLDCESRSDEVLMALSKIVKRTVGGYKIWVGGKKVQIGINGDPVELYPTDTLTIIPKIQYMVTVVVREEIADRVSLPKTLTINADVNIL